MAGLFDGTSLERPVTCARCGKPLAPTPKLAACNCPRDAGGNVKPPKDQPARVHRERRRGKWTTVITGLDPHATDMPTLCTSLKTMLATGGGVSKGDDPAIELQGDHRDRLVEHLRSLGYPAKAAGG